MLYSGYSEKFRADVMESALHAYIKITKLDQEGTQPIHRTEEEWKGYSLKERMQEDGIREEEQTL